MDYEFLLLSALIDTTIKLSDMLEKLNIGKLIVVPVGIFNELLKDMTPVLTDMISTVGNVCQIISKIRS